MAKKNTVFQALDRAITGNWGSNDMVTPHINSYDLSGGKGDDILFRTTDKEEYLNKKLELQQNKYLKDRWIKANVNLSVTAYAGLNNVKLMYRDADMMDAFPEIGAALDIVSEEACLYGDTRIKLLNGETKTIRELYNDNYKDFWVYAVDEHGNCKPSHVDKVLFKGKKELYLITLDDGTEIKCTGDHKWMISDGTWAETKDLSFGDSLVSIYEKTDKHTHRVISVQNLGVVGDVYDLANSSVNACYGVRCNNGQIISHNCITNADGNIVNVYSKSERIKSILEDLFVNRLNIQLTGQMVIRAMCKYGNQFMLLDIDNKNGVKGWKQLPVFNVERIENGIQNPYGGASVSINGINKNEADLSTQFIWLDDNNSQTPFRDWQVAHFRLLANSLYLPYGVSFLNSARRHWRMLSLMEDMMLIYRLERSIERRVYKIYVGAIDDADVQAYVEEVANQFKRTPIIDPMTGQVDLRKNLLDVSQDIFVPVRDENAPTPIDTLSAAQNMTALDDIKFVQNKVFTALRIPKTFLNFEENAGDGKNLALLDIRFTRTINRVQQAFLMELTKIATIHLFLLGFGDELTNFTLSMNNPSTQAEGLEIENMQKKIDAVRDAVSDPGNGLPVMSQTRALKEIMKWSEKEIKENFEEIRLEKGIAAELEKTTQIIKKTGIFDKVDRLYGEPGAEYMDDQQQQGGDEMGGGDMGGAPPMGGGGADLGGELDALGEPGGDESGDIGGTEGSMPTAGMGSGGDVGMENQGGEQPMESKSRKKPLIVETAFERYLNKLSGHKVPEKETKFERAKIYDSESLLINEEFDKMIGALSKFVDNDEQE